MKIKFQFKKRHHARGFTLVELLLATAIFTFFLMIAIAGILVIMQIFIKASIVTANQQIARNVLDDIRRESTFATNVSVVSTGLPPTSAQGNVPGLCITRNSGGNVFYFLYQPPGGPTYPHGAQQLNIVNAQYNAISISTSSEPPGVALNDSYFTQKTLYKRTGGNCDSADAVPTAWINGKQAQALSGTSGAYNGENVQFFNVQEIDIDHDSYQRTYNVSLMVTQAGPPALAFGSSKNQFDDTVVMSSTIYPNLLP